MHLRQQDHTFDIVILLMSNSIKNNIVVYNQVIFSKILDVAPVTIARSISKLKKLKILKNIKQKKNYTLLQISPHVAWMGDQDSLKQALKDWDMPIVPKDRFEIYENFKSSFDPIVRSERKSAFFH